MNKSKLFVTIESSYFTSGGSQRLPGDRTYFTYYNYSSSCEVSSVEVMNEENNTDENIRPTLSPLRILMSIDLILWYVRLLYIITASKDLGPKLTMIYEMVSVLWNESERPFPYASLLQMKDAIKTFFCIILVILIGFSVASWSLLTTKQQVVWPNTTHESSHQTTEHVKVHDESFEWQLLRDVFNWGVWKVFGQVAEPYNDAVSGTFKTSICHYC